MSWKAVAWALAQRAPTSSAKFVLVALADTAHVEDWLAWPSIAHLSDTTQQDRKTVMENLKRLEDAQLIARTTAHMGRTGQIPVWRLPVEPASTPANKPEIGTASAVETVPKFPANSTNFPSKQYQKRDTEPLMNQEGTRERAGAKRAPPFDCGSRLPSDWQLSTAGRNYCLKRRPDLDPDRLAEGFRDYWLAKSGKEALKSDWAAAWRTWVRTEKSAVSAGASQLPDHDLASDHA